MLSRLPPKSGAFLAVARMGDWALSLFYEHYRDSVADWVDQSTCITCAFQLVIVLYNLGFALGADQHFKEFFLQLSHISLHPNG